MHNRLIYGYFRNEEGAKGHLKKAKRSDRGTSKTFTYRCEKRDRGKEGRKRWIAYRLEEK